MAFPGPHAHIIYNEAGEPLGWDYPSDPDPNDWADFSDDDGNHYDEDDDDFEMTDNV